MTRFTEDVDFLFVYEVQNREIDSICLLWAWLESKGYKVGIINTWDSMFHRHPEYRAKVAVISACYSDGTYAFFTGHALHFDKVVNLQWEQVLVNSATQGDSKSDWDFRGTIPWKTRHVCWGENNRNYLHSRFGIDLDKLRVCGYLPLDFYREEFRAASPGREELFARYGLDPSRKTLLFISSFADLGKPESEVNLMEGDTQDNAENVRLQEKSRELILEWLKKLAREDESLQIIYRAHPAEANSPEILQTAREIPNFHAINRENIRNWIMNCDILCNGQSTSMIELYASGKKTLLLRPTEIPFKFAMPIYEEGKFRAATTYEELAAWIREEDPAFPVEKDKLLQFYSMTEQPVYERVGQYLVDTLLDPEYRCEDPGNHLTAKGRILVRVRTRAGALLSKAAYGITGQRRKKDGEPSPRAAKIRENYEHYCYYEQKMRQNRVPPQELRKTIDAYRKMMESGWNGR